MFYTQFDLKTGQKGQKSGPFQPKPAEIGTKAAENGQKQQFLAHYNFPRPRGKQARYARISLAREASLRSPPSLTRLFASRPRKGAARGVASPRWLALREARKVIA